VTERSDAPLQAFTLLAVAGFAAVASMRICDAMLPALVQTFSARPAEAARVISAFAVGYGLSQLVYGPLSDRFGRARVIAWATLACCAGSVLAALAPSIDALVAARVLSGATAAGIVPTTMALIGDRVPYAQRQVVLARLLSATVIGTIGGAWMGGVLSDTLGWRVAFWGLALLFSAAGVVLLRSQRLHAVPHRIEGEHPSFVQRTGHVLSLAWARRVYLVTFIEGALVYGVIAFVPSHLHHRFGLTLSAAGGVLALFGAGGLVYSRLARFLLRRFGEGGLARTGGVMLGLAYALLAFGPGWGWAMPGCALAGLGYYMLHNTLQARATQLTERARGTAVSLFSCSLFLGQSAGIAVAALCVEHASAEALFAIAGPGLVLLAWVFAAQLRARAAAGHAEATA